MKTALSRPLAVVVATALLAGAAVLHAGAKTEPDPAAKLRADIGALVADPARQAKMLAAVDEIQAAAGELDSLMADQRASLHTLLADPGATRAAVDASLDGFNTRRESLAQRVLASHVALKSGATPAEWKKLRKREMDMIMSAATKTIGQAASGKED